MSGYFERFGRDYGTLAMILTFDSMGGDRGFTEADREAMTEGLETIRTALVQPVGTCAAYRAPGAVSDVEFRHAVMRVVLASVRMWLSGRLAEVRCDSDD